MKSFVFIVLFIFMGLIIYFPNVIMKSFDELFENIIAVEND